MRALIASTSRRLSIFFICWPIVVGFQHFRFIASQADKDVVSLETRYSAVIMMRAHGRVAGAAGLSVLFNCFFKIDIITQKQHSGMV